MAASLLVLGTAAVAPFAAASSLSPAGNGAALAVTAAQLRLPAPTGPYAVGESTLHLRDTGRADPYVPEAGVRELLASVFYPAWAGSGVPAPYMSAKEADLLESRGRGGLVEPPGWSGQPRRTRVSERRPRAAGSR